MRPRAARTAYRADAAWPLLKMNRSRSARRAERDRFILSKGHAASALYAVLAARGLIARALLDGFHVDGGTLSGHPDRLTVPFVEVSTGSLGHGLPRGT